MDDTGRGAEGHSRMILTNEQWALDLACDELSELADSAQGKTGAEREAILRKMKDIVDRVDGEGAFERHFTCADFGESAAQKSSD